MGVCRSQSERKRINRDRATPVLNRTSWIPARSIRPASFLPPFYFCCFCCYRKSEAAIRAGKSIKGKHDMTPSSSHIGLGRKDYAQQPCSVLHIPNTSHPVSNSLHICAFLFDTLLSIRKIGWTTDEPGQGMEVFPPNPLLALFGSMNTRKQLANEGSRREVLK